MKRSGRYAVGVFVHSSPGHDGEGENVDGRDIGAKRGHAICAHGRIC
jgi:hypothetical protein